MKKHLQLLFDQAHRWLTISFFLASVLQIVASQIMGTTDNIPALLVLLSGMICLFFALLHPWKKSNNYGILAGVSFGLILLTFLFIYILMLLKKTEYISEGVVMIFTGLICLPGIIAGIIGAMYWGSRKK
jgi:Na+-transporting NADH:ubiquinone oxidoreductase subunit NqrB